MTLYPNRVITLTFHKKKQYSESSKIYGYDILTRA